MNTPEILNFLREKYDEKGEVSSTALEKMAESFHMSYGQAAGCASFYSCVNGLPQERVLAPDLKREGELVRYGKKQKWTGLEKARARPESIWNELKVAGLSGRGGGAFYTAEKWLAVKNTASAEKIVICNVSEGEPGTCKDLFLLLSYPEIVIEGMVICALAVGAKRGYVYIRAGYEDAAAVLRRALADNKERLGEFPIDVIVNLGAYVCGEETALVASLDGRRGEPAKKPPYPVEKGFMGHPTVINNAETFAAAALLMAEGSEAFPNGMSRLYTVTGCGAKAAVCEMPVATTPRKLYEAAGCTESMKAFQIGGGASGAIFPAAYMDVPFESDEAQKLGITVGTGSIRFLSDSESPAALCTEIAAFYANESCGKCTPCRYGCKKLLEMLLDNTYSAEQLKELVTYIKGNAFCALGKSAGNALVSALRFFPEDFARAKEKEMWI